MDQNYEKDWKERWEAIVMKNGEIDLEQVKKELSDYRYLLQQVPTVYSELADLSKPFYSAQTIITRAHEKQEEYARDIYLEDIKAMADEDGNISVEDIENYFN
ncbi:hypothetical protein, partial [Bacillus sp. UNC437CL72CviS29]|uniref:hypothetical protein n=1 Tax=Bacillus sp. UNC437CL72CviS29 TaxID=1340430 RepID=UPI0005596E38